MNACLQHKAYGYKWYCDYCNPRKEKPTPQPSRPTAQPTVQSTMQPTARPTAQPTARPVQQTQYDEDFETAIAASLVTDEKKIFKTPTLNQIPNDYNDKIKLFIAHSNLDIPIFYNQNNLCYFHSLMQFLLSNPYFLVDLKNPNLPKSIKGFNILQNWSSQNFTNNAGDILKAVNLQLGRQQDPEELLAGLHTKNLLENLCPSMMFEIEETIYENTTTKKDYNATMLGMISIDERKPQTINHHYYSNTTNPRYRFLTLPKCLYLNVTHLRNEKLRFSRNIKILNYNYYLAAIIYKSGGNEYGHYISLISRKNNNGITYYLVNDRPDSNGTIDSVSVNVIGDNQLGNYVATSVMYCLYKEDNIQNISDEKQLASGQLTAVNEQINLYESLLEKLKVEKQNLEAILRNNIFG